MPGEVRRSRLIQYVGKGGVGKTTMAAATAARAAALGHRTLVVSTDLAHSLGDVLDANLGADPVQIGPFLHAQEISVLDEARDTLGRVQGQLSGLLKKAGISEIQADELAVLPGLDEVAGLARIAAACRSGDFDCVVVDSGPTGETIRLLGMPESFQWYANRLQEWSKLLPRLLPSIVRRAVPEVNLAEALGEAKQRVADVRALMSDPELSSYRLVVTPDRMVLKEAERAETFLNLFEYPVDAVILNRVPPSADDATGLWKSMVERQWEIVAEIGIAFAGLPILQAPLRAQEPVGTQALEALARELFGDRDPVAVLHVGATQRIERRGDGYVLQIVMPHVDTTKLTLRKRGDTLHVAAGSVRREIPLPRTLAMLEPTGARMTEGTLEISFVPRRETPAT